VHTLAQGIASAPGGHSSLVATLVQQVTAALERHRGVRSVRLVGSRAEGRAHAHSDWDFLVETDEFRVVAGELPSLCELLHPIAQQWDRLSPHYCWMLTLPGPTKVDLVFADQLHRQEPPWEPTRENLVAIDLHFWDWTLWLQGKQTAGKRDLVDAELKKLHRHLLAPLGVQPPPTSLRAAVAAYREAREQAERRFDLQVPRDLETEVAAALHL
jgi:Nucleotidyltransferase domain